MHFCQLPSIEGPTELLLIDSTGLARRRHQLTHHAFTVELELEIAIEPQHTARQVGASPIELEADRHTTHNGRCLGAPSTARQLVRSSGPGTKDRRASRSTGSFTLTRLYSAVAHPVNSTGSQQAHRFTSRLRRARLPAKRYPSLRERLPTASRTACDACRR